MNRGFGYRRDHPEEGELVFGAGAPSDAFETGSIRWARRGVLDQGPANSCVAFALARALHLGFVLEGHEDAPLPSPMWLYWAARRLEYTGLPEDVPALTDDGAYPRLAVQGLQTLGFCPSTSWPYDPRGVNRPPGFRAFQEAYDQRGLTCLRIEGSGEERVRRVATALRAGLCPVFGMDVDDNFQRHEGATVIEAIDSSRIVGGHMVAILDVTADGVGIDNSWGPAWGVDGTATLSRDLFGSTHVHDVYALAVAPLRKAQAVS